MASGISQVLVTSKITQLVCSVDWAHMEIVTGSWPGGTKTRPHEIPLVVVDVDTLLGCLVWCNKNVAWVDVRFIKQSDVKDRGLNVRTLWYLVWVDHQCHFMYSLI